MSLPILIFTNFQSGGGLASELVEELKDDNSIFFVNLPNEQHSFTETYSDLLHNSNLRCVVAGGDGSVNWVVQLLSNYFPRDESQNNRPPLAVIPLGTGNDMSRALGWGKGTKKSQIKDIQNFLKEVRQSSHIEKVDCWQVKFERTDKNEVIKKQMLNYFSIGVDAEIAKNFEDFRKGCCGCCICCQCMSLTCYVPVALRSLCCKRAITDYLTVDIESEASPDELETVEDFYCDEDATNSNVNTSLDVNYSNNSNKILRRLKAKSSEKTLVFQAITSIYAGRDLWADKSSRSMSDGKFEVVTEGGVFRLGFAQIGCNTAKPFGQGHKALIIADEPLYYQIDGEGAQINGPSNITVEWIDSYPFIFGNVK